MSINSADALMAPLSVRDFVDRHLEKEVLHLERDDADLVEGIFDLDSMSHCLRFMSPQLRDLIRVIPRGDASEKTAASNAVAKGADDHGLSHFVAEFGEGSTLTFNMAETYWPPVSDIVTDLRRALASDVRCNVYCTPPESQGFDTHVDAHDVLVLQTSGSKTWRIHDVQTELPVESSTLMAEMFPRLAGSMPDHGEPTREVVLRPGDLLYLPRGVPHSAASTTEHSVHLTIGLYPLRTHEFIGKIIDLAAFADVRLRRRVDAELIRGEIPSASAGDLLREVAGFCDELEEPLDVSRLLAATNEEYQPQPGTPGMFQTAIAIEGMDLDSVVEWPEGVTWTTRRTPHDFRAVCGGRMALPLKLEPVIDFLENTRCFRVGDAPGILKDSAKLTLCRNLVKNGLLRITGRQESLSGAPEVTGVTAPGLPDWLAPSGF